MGPHPCIFVPEKGGFGGSREAGGLAIAFSIPYTEKKVEGGDMGSDYSFAPEYNLSPCQWEAVRNTLRDREYDQDRFVPSSKSAAESGEQS